MQHQEEWTFRFVAILVFISFLILIVNIQACDKRDQELKLKMADKGYCWLPLATPAYGVSHGYRPCNTVVLPAVVEGK